MLDIVYSVKADKEKEEELPMFAEHKKNFHFSSFGAFTLDKLHTLQHYSKVKFDDCDNIKPILEALYPEQKYSISVEMRTKLPLYYCTGAVCCGVSLMITICYSPVKNACEGISRVRTMCDMRRVRKE